MNMLSSNYLIHNKIDEQREKSFAFPLVLNHFSLRVRRMVQHKYDINMKNTAIIL